MHSSLLFLLFGTSWLASALPSGSSAASASSSSWSALNPRNEPADALPYPKDYSAATCSRSDPGPGAPSFNDGFEQSPSQPAYPLTISSVQNKGVQQESASDVTYRDLSARNLGDLCKQIGHFKFTDYKPRSHSLARVKQIVLSPGNTYVFTITSSQRIDRVQLLTRNPYYVDGWAAQVTNEVNGNTGSLRWTPMQAERVIFQVWMRDTWTHTGEVALFSIGRNLDLGNGRVLRWTEDPVTGVWEWK